MEASRAEFEPHGGFITTRASVTSLRTG